MQAKKLDIFLLFAMLGLSIIAAYFFFRPISFDSTDRRLFLATIEAGKNIVKMRSSSSPFWQDALPHDLLSDRDLIYTHEESSASILLNNGANIVLGEKTLFRLDQDQLGKTALELQRGTLKASIPAGGIEITSNQVATRLTGKGSEVLVFKQDGVQLLTPLSDGIKVDLGADGGQVVLKTDEQLVMNSTKSKAHILRSLRLIEAFPAINQHFYSTSPFPLTFNYKLDKPDASVIQLSRHAGFNKLIALNGNQGSLEEEGQYYWRVGQNVEGRLQWSNPRPFSLNLLRPAQLVSPHANAQLGPLEDNGSMELLLKWKAAHASTFIISLLTPGQEELTYSSDQPQLKLVLNQAGNYQWKVTSVYQGKTIQKLESRWQSFTIRSMPAMVAATLSMPADGASLSLFSAKGIGVNLAWKAAGSGIESWVDLFDAQGQHLSKHVVQDSKLFLPLKKFGKYQWQVGSRNQQGHEVLSERFAFNIRYIQLKSNFPDQGVELQLERPNQNVKFEWQANSPVARYLYELSTQQDFSTIVLSREVMGNRLELTFPQLGVYYWRTKIILPNGDFSFSEPVRVQVSPSPPPEAPELEPESIFKIELRSQVVPHSFLWRYVYLINSLVSPLVAQVAENPRDFQTQATLVWKKYSNAAFYQVEIYRDAEARELLLSQKVRTEQLVFDNPGAGDYFWRVAIIDHWGRQGPFSKLALLKLVLSAKLDPLVGAELLLPRLKEQLTPQAIFRWKGDSRGLEYQLQLSRDNNFSSIIYQRKTQKEQIKLPSSLKLEVDQYYYWRVLTTDDLNRQAASEVRKIKVAGEPVIEPPAIGNDPTPTKVKVPRYLLALNMGVESLSYQQQQGSNTISFDGMTPLSTVIGIYSLVPSLIPGFEFSVLLGNVFDQDYALYQVQVPWRFRPQHFNRIELWTEVALHCLSVSDFSRPDAVDQTPSLNKGQYLFLPRFNVGALLPIDKNWHLQSGFSLSYDFTNSYYGLALSLYRKVFNRFELGITAQHSELKFDDSSLESNRLSLSAQSKF